jgi:hypothetical protein
MARTGPAESKVAGPVLPWRKPMETWNGHTCSIGVPDPLSPLRTDMAHCKRCNVPATLNVPPNDRGAIGATGTIADTPENRAALEAAAIPRCREWREANPECRYLADPRVDPIAREQIGVCVDPEHMIPAPYCCSAYCDRCTGLRALDGVQPLTPNEWMTQ